VAISAKATVAGREAGKALGMAAQPTTVLLGRLQCRDVLGHLFLLGSDLL
jgi:hypothetical protein